MNYLISPTLSWRGRKRRRDTNQLYRATTYDFEEAFRAAFEAGIASDLDVEKAWKKFQKA
jgi:hypothetical protein